MFYSADPRKFGPAADRVRASHANGRCLDMADIRSCTVRTEAAEECGQFRARLGIARGARFGGTEEGRADRVKSR